MIDDFSWAIGYLEGEGTFGTYCTSRKRGYWAPTIAVTSTDLENVERLRRILGGGIGGPYKSPGIGTKPIYHWMLHGRDRCTELFLKFRPHLSPRRQAQIDKALALLEAHPARRAKKEK